MSVRFAGLWRHAAFGKLWTASAISDVGSQVTAIALPLLAALTLAATPWQMGLLSAAESLPALLVGLFAGVWVDRLRRRPLLIATDLGRAALLLTIPLASGFGLLRFELLYAVALATGALTVLFDVAHISFVPSLVGRHQLVEGNAKLEATWSAAKVVGPGVGGLLVSALGAATAVLVDAVSFVLSAIFIGRIDVNESAPERNARAGVFAEIAEGLRIVAGHPTLRVLAGCSATTSLFGRMFMAVYVLYMTRELGLSAVSVGLVLATGGVGALAGALVTERASRRFGLGPTMVGAQLFFGLTGLAVPLAVLVPRFALELVVGSEFTQWMAVQVYFINAISLRQALTPDRLQGRVNATSRFIVGGALPTGALLGGALGGVIGTTMTLVVAEFGLLLACLWLLLSPVRGVRDVDGVRKIEAAPAVG